MTKAELTKYEKSILLFFIKGTLSDLSKALIFFFIFYFLGLHKEFLWGLFFLIIFRTYSGGIHCKAYWSCLLLSFVILSSGVILGKFVYITKTFATIICIVCLLIVCKHTPTQAKTRPPLSKNEILKSKFQESIIITIFTIVIIISNPQAHLNIGMWILIIHTLQLFIANIRR